MLETIPVTSEKVYTFNGLYDMMEVYSFLKNYIEGSIYYYDVSEKDYAEDNVDGKRKIMSKLEAVKVYNDYFKIVMKLEILMTGNTVEVEVNGRKKMLVKGTAKISINSYVKPDWNATKDKSVFSSFLSTLHDRFVGNDELGDCVGHAAGDVGKVVAQFKQHMGAGIK